LNYSEKRVRSHCDAGHLGLAGKGVRDRAFKRQSAQVAAIATTDAELAATRAGKHHPRMPHGCVHDEVDVKSKFPMLLTLLAAEIKP
jgi:hypothetical protein